MTAPLYRDPAKTRLEETYPSIFSERLYLYTLRRRTGWRTVCPVCGYSASLSSSSSQILECRKVCRGQYAIPLSFDTKIQMFMVQVEDLLGLGTDTYFLNYDWNPEASKRISRERLKEMLEDWKALKESIDECKQGTEQCGREVRGSGDGEPEPRGPENGSARPTPGLLPGGDRQSSPDGLLHPQRPSAGESRSGTEGGGDV